MFTIDPLTGTILILYGIALLVLFRKNRNTYSFAVRNQVDIEGINSTLVDFDDDLSNFETSFNDLVNGVDAIDTEVGDLNETITRTFGNIDEHFKQLEVLFEKLTAKQRATQSDVEQVIVEQLATKDRGVKSAPVTKATPKPVKKSKPSAKKPTTKRKTTR